MKIGVFGTGVVGQVIAEKLESLGHDVMIGTRDVDALMASTASDFMGNPPFPVWHAQNSGVKVGSFAHCRTGNSFCNSCSVSRTALALG